MKGHEFQWTIYVEIALPSQQGVSRQTGVVRDPWVGASFWACHYDSTVFHVTNRKDGLETLNLVEDANS